MYYPELRKISREKSFHLLNFKGKDAIFSF